MSSNHQMDKKCRAQHMEKTYMIKTYSSLGRVMEGERGLREE